MNPIVKKLEKKFHKAVLKTIFEKLQTLPAVELREIAEADCMKGCKNEIQKFISATFSASAEAVLKSKYGIELRDQKAVQE